MVKPTRKNKIRIISAVLDKIDKKALTINEIAEAIDSHWLTVREVVVFLEKHKLIEGIDEQGERKYKISEGHPREELTYFSIPTDTKTKALALYLFNKIKETWLSTKGEMINKTFSQKIAIDVIEALKLDIPCGWYKFGKITLFNIDPNKDYGSISTPQNSEEIDAQIQKSVDKFKGLKYTWEIRKVQYEEYNNVQYQINQNLELIGNNMIDLESEQNKKALTVQLEKLKNQIQDNNETKEIKLTLMNFISLINNYMLTGVHLNEIKDLLHKSYESVWDVVATYNFYQSLSENEKYDKKILKSYFDPYIEEKINEANDRIMELSVVA
ncbi:MAG: hypothetical protein Q8O89_08920 [Nanoarchaeota archaeon]|nr:hypothetical protein [Nanoarchaeota archaeon]